MTSKIFNLKVFYSFLFLFVISIHALLRIPEIPTFHTSKHGEYWWYSSINYGAGKEFTEDNTFLKESPELKSLFPDTPTEFSIFDTIHQFKDYTPQSNYIRMNDSLGYRFLVGNIWKYFGFNWYYVGLLNYVLSLLALLSLMYCSFRTLGITYSVLIGLIYSISLPEFSFVIQFPRDGSALWFSSYLICAFVIMSYKPPTFQRITLFTILIGIIIFGAIECRNSNIYFLPISIFFYFLFFYFFTKNDIKLAYFFNIKSLFWKRSFLFLYSILITLFTIFILTKFLLYFLPEYQQMPSGHLAHIIFLGLGVWGQEIFHPSQVRYLDTHVDYFARDYGVRVLNYNANDISYLSTLYGKSITHNYLAIISYYPYFFYYVVKKSFFNMLILLGDPLGCNYFCLEYLYTPFIEKITFIFRGPRLFILSFFGSLILYFRLNKKFLLIILLTLIFFNAGISFFQYNARHGLMAHPSYYFLSGVTLAFIFENVSKIFFTFLKSPSISIKTILTFNYKKIYSHINKIRTTFTNSKLFLTLTYITIPFIIISITYPLLEHKLYSLEKNNIKVMQIFFHTLKKNHLEVNLTETPSKLPTLLLAKTVGIYCNLGEVNSPKPIAIAFHQNGENLYQTTISPINGKNVVVFIPFFYANENYLISMNHNNQCKSFYWSDLKDWKGPLWEGSYDENLLEKQK